MLTWKDCDFCGDALHCFAEELENGSVIYVRVCPTCYFTPVFLNTHQQRIYWTPHVEKIEPGARAVPV